MKAGKVATEVAEGEFARWADSMGLELPDAAKLAKMNDEDRRSLEEQVARVQRAIELGNLVVDDTGNFVFTPVVGDRTPITFFEPTGASIMAMDQRKAGHVIAKTYAVLADITKQPIQRFAAMANRDRKICEAILSLFLG